MNTRPATSEDSEFVYQVKVDALKEYVEKTWGWNEEFQRKFHKNNFNHEETEIILYQDNDAGFLIVKEGEIEIELKEINLLRKFQRKGIGSSIIKEIKVDAEKKNKGIRLQVLKVNPVIELYKKSGFRVFGETETHYLMKSNTPQSLPHGF